MSALKHAMSCRHLYNTYTFQMYYTHGTQTEKYKSDQPHTYYVKNVLIEHRRIIYLYRVPICIIIVVIMKQSISVKLLLLSPNEHPNYIIILLYYNNFYIIIMASDFYYLVIAYGLFNYFVY